jgi:hypothetical protein
MREWFRERDVLGVENEEVLTEELSADDALEVIMARAYGSSERPPRLVPPRQRVDSHALRGRSRWL